jgi:hypothetical protein
MDESLSKLDAIEAEHVQFNPKPFWCKECDHQWPCPTSRLAKALRLALTGLELIEECEPDGAGMAVQYRAAALSALDEA